MPSSSTTINHITVLLTQVKLPVRSFPSMLTVFSMLDVAGDISRQVALRKKLRCKSFKWFMTEVAFDLVDHYPPVEPPDYATGEVRKYAESNV